MKATKNLLQASLWMSTILLLIAALVSQADAQTCVPPPAGLVSWWPGDGNADDIQGGNHGTLLNGATFATGMVGQAFSFDGINDLVAIADKENLRPANLTLSAWVNTADADLRQQPIIAKNHSVGNWISYMLRIQDGGKLGLILGGNRAQNREAHWLTLSTLASNRWYHVAATWQNLRGDSTDAKIYIDGVEQMVEMNINKNYSPTFTIDYTTLPLFIGRDEFPSGHFKGLVDEVDIYDRVLSAAEIQSIFFAGSTGKCKKVSIATAIPAEPSAPVITASAALAFRKQRCENTP